MNIQKIQREEAILLSLAKLDYLSRSQIQKLHNLSGDRNARRILVNMKEFVSNFRDERGGKIYYLNKKGRELTNCNVTRGKITQVNHYIMRNDYFIYCRPAEWKNEIKFTVKDVVTVVPDAYFKHDQKICFLEVDHLQHMNKNKEKITRYRKLKELGVFQQKYKQFPVLVWVTLTENKRRVLLKWCEGLEVKVYLWNEIK